MLTEEERVRLRQLMAEEDRKANERGQKGFVDVAFDEKEQKLRDRIVRLAAVARSAAKAKIAVRAFDDEGAPVTLEDRVGNEDMIFLALLNQMSARGQEETR